MSYFAVVLTGGRYVVHAVGTDYYGMPLKLPEDHFAAKCGCGGWKCAACNVCHACTARTQKFKGIREWEGGKKIDTSQIISLTCPKSIEWVTFFWTNWSGIGGGKMFARPCPVRPRHGFVDSRVITSEKALVALVEETRSADPEGEIMLSSYIDAKWNAIWTPSMMTFGKGHDGATAGDANVLMIPLAGVYDREAFGGCAIAEGEVPYIEWVGQQIHGGGTLPVATQVRSGPAVTTTSRDFIPRPVEVGEVIVFDPEMTFLTWEALMEGAKDRPGVVVYHPNGSVCDHATVHARSRNIPIVTFPVAVGDQLVPSGEVATPNPLAVLDGIALGDTMKLDPNQLRPVVGAILLGLHHSAALSGNDGKWIGVAAALMIRLGSMALRGEARHEQSVKHKPRREAVYTRHVNRSLTYHRAGVVRLLNTFRYGNFGHNAICASGGTGGMKWAACAASLIPLFNAIRALALKEDQESVQAIVRALNRSVNQAHNNGWWLNKFMEGRNIAMFHAIPEGDPSELIDAGKFIYSTFHGQQAPPKAARYAAWREVRVTSPAPIKMTLGLPPGGLYISATVRGMKSKLNIPVVLDSMDSLLSSMVSLDWSGGRYRVMPTGVEKAGAKGSGDPTPLWEEPPLEETQAIGTR